jgi:hypothetical protein
MLPLPLTSRETLVRAIGAPLASTSLTEIFTVSKPSARTLARSTVTVDRDESTLRGGGDEPGLTAQPVAANDETIRRARIVEARLECWLIALDAAYTVPGVSVVTSISGRRRHNF